VKDKVHAAHLVLDGDLVALVVGKAHAAHSVIGMGLAVHSDMAGVITAGKVHAVHSAQEGRVSIGVSLMNCWRCALRLPR